MQPAESHVSLTHFNLFFLVCLFFLFCCQPGDAQPDDAAKYGYGDQQDDAAKYGYGEFKKNYIEETFNMIW